MHGFCCWLANCFQNLKLIDKEETENLRFLIELIITQCVTFISVCVIGFFLIGLINTLIINIIFIIARKYIGGFHAKTFLSCYCMTVLHFIFTYYIYEKIPPIVFIIVGLLLSILIIIDRKDKKIIEFNIYYAVACIVLLRIETVYYISVANYTLIMLMKFLERK